jgi:hypothetical protein
MPSLPLKLINSPLRVRAARAVALPAARTLELFSGSSQKLPSNREARQPHSRSYYFFKSLRATLQSRFVFPLSRLPGYASLRDLSAVFRFAPESLPGYASFRSLSAVFRFAPESLQGYASLRSLSAVFRFAPESLQGYASFRSLSAVFRFAPESLPRLFLKTAILVFIF